MKEVQNVTGFIVWLAHRTQEEVQHLQSTAPMWELCSSTLTEIGGRNSSSKQKDESFPQPAGAELH